MPGGSILRCNVIVNSKKVPIQMFGFFKRLCFLIQNNYGGCFLIIATNFVDIFVSVMVQLLSVDTFGNLEEKILSADGSKKW